MKRRDFLRGGLATAAAAAGLTISRARSQAWAFGALPAGGADVMLPAERRVDSVLELFLFGGVSQHESFYTVPSLGESDRSGWHAFVDSTEFQSSIDACGVGEVLEDPFAVDQAGNEVHLGPFAAPLRARRDILDRTRIMVTAHGLLPHEAAVPLALTGRRLGQPTMAGLGAHIARYYAETGAAPTIPASYVLTPDVANVFDAAALASSIGTHPGTARPLNIKIDAATDFTALVQRGEVGSDKAAFDELIRTSSERYARRLERGGRPLRSRHVAEYGNATTAIGASGSLADVLEPKFFEPIEAEACGRRTSVDALTMNLRLGARLLTREEGSARYVAVIDAGLDPSSDAGGYDSHSDNCQKQATNLAHAMRALTDVIAAPGESGTGKIDLSRTLVIINTEFGRTPLAEGNRGRGHWTAAYPVLLLGGPVTAQNAGIHGGIAPDYGASAAVSPVAHRIAALVALGIWPFAPESYNVGDLESLDERSAVADIVSTYWGVA